MLDVGFTSLVWESARASCVLAATQSLERVMQPGQLLQNACPADDWSAEVHLAWPRCVHLINGTACVSICKGKTDNVLEAVSSVLIGSRCEQAPFKMAVQAVYVGF